MMLGACGNSASNAGSTEANDSTATTTINTADETTVTVETVKFEKNESTAEVSILVQWPMEGNKPLVDSLRHHIAYLLDSEIDGPKAKAQIP